MLQLLTLMLQLENQLLAGDMASTALQMLHFFLTSEQLEVESNITMGDLNKISIIIISRTLTLTKLIFNFTLPRSPHSVRRL